MVSHHETRIGATSEASVSYLWLAVPYLIFVIYGSLVPLNYHPLPWDEAVERFRQIPFLNLGIGSRADWVANILLFIPLSFLWAGATWSSRRSAQLFASMAVWGLCVILSVAIEFTQLFFPPRTVSQNDLMAESLGALVGIAGWWLWGGKTTLWLASWRRSHGRADVAHKLLWAYLLVLFGYNLLPLDLTLSPVELFHKWNQGKMYLIPFASVSGDPFQLVYSLGTDTIIWAPVALFFVLRGRKSPFRAWLDTTLLAVLLEVLQLFVFSRISDVTDVITAACGAGLGAWGASWLSRETHASTHLRSSTDMPWLWALAGLGWAMLLPLVFWYPYEFSLDREVLTHHMAQFWEAPFVSYYYGTEYRAATELLHKFSFFAPIGILAAIGAWRETDWLRRRWYGPGAFLATVGMAFVVEAGKFFMPSKSVDFANVALEISGGVLGYWLTRRILRSLTDKPATAASLASSSAQASPTRTPTKHAVHAKSWNGPHPLLILAMLYFGLWGISVLPGVPYNVKELFADGPAWLSAFLLALFILWSSASPVWFARRLADSPAALWQVPVFMLAYGGVGYVLLRFAVPMESLNDIVGSPVLAWPWEWELLGRFAALHVVPGALIMVAVQSARQIRGRHMGPWHWLAAAPVLGISYWVVIVQADTDNLTELLAPHDFASTCVAMVLFGLFLAAALVASPSPVRRGLPAASVAASLGLAFLGLRCGLAWDLEKYGQHFSALQFLLSEDRAHYVSSTVAWLRYAGLHLVAIGALVLIQRPFLRGRATHRRRSSPVHGDERIVGAEASVME